MAKNNITMQLALWLAVKNTDADMVHFTSGYDPADNTLPCPICAGSNQQQLRVVYDDDRWEWMRDPDLRDQSKAARNTAWMENRAKHLSARSDVKYIEVYDTVEQHVVAHYRHGVRFNVYCPICGYTNRVPANIERGTHTLESVINMLDGKFTAYELSQMLRLPDFCEWEDSREAGDLWMHLMDWTEERLIADKKLDSRGKFKVQYKNGGWEWLTFFTCPKCNGAGCDVCLTTPEPFEKMGVVTWEMLREEIFAIEYDEIYSECELPYYRSWERSIAAAANEIGRAYGFNVEYRWHKEGGDYWLVPQNKEEGWSKPLTDICAYYNVEPADLPAGTEKQQFIFKLITSNGLYAGLFPTARHAFNEAMRRNLEYVQ